MTSRYNNLYTPLSSNQEWSGYAEPTRNFEYVSVSIQTDQITTVYIEFNNSNNDDSTWNNLNIFNYSPSDLTAIYNVKVSSNYYRVRAECGNTSQGFISLTSRLKQSTVDNLPVIINDSVQITGNVGINDPNLSNIASNVALINSTYANTIVNLNYNRVFEYDSPIQNSSIGVISQANTEVFADSTVVPTTKPLKYKGIDGLYLQKATANNHKFNIYYFNGFLEQNRPLSSLTGLVAELSNITASNKFFFTVYTKPTSMNDYIPNFAHSAVVYSINTNNIPQSKQLIYWGSTPVNKGNLPLIQATYNAFASQGEQQPTEPIGLISFQSDSAALPFEICLSGLGYSLNGINQFIKCKSYEEYPASYLDIQALSGGLSNVNIINTANTNILNTVNVGGNVNITNTSLAITNSDITALNSKILTDDPMGSAGNVYVRDQGANVLLTNLNNKFDSLNSTIDSANIHVRLHGLHNTTWLPVKVSNTGVLDTDATLDQNTTSNIGYIYSIQNQLLKSATNTVVILDNITLNASLSSASGDLTGLGIDIRKPLTISFTTTTTTSGAGIFLQASNNNSDWWILEGLHTWASANQQQRAWTYPNGLGARYIRIRNPTAIQLVNVYLAVLGFSI